MSALLLKVAAALLNGATLRTPTHTVGPDRQPFDADEKARFVCLAHDGMPVFAWEEWDEAESPTTEDRDRRGNLAAFVPHKRRDWSAFGAARAFLSAVPEHEAHIALRRLKQARRGDFQERPEVEVIYRRGDRAVAATQCTLAQARSAAHEAELALLDAQLSAGRGVRA